MPTSVQSDGRPRSHRASRSNIVHGRYRICGSLGRGAYGMVMRGTDMKTGIQVAIKEINHLFDNVDDSKRSLREVMLLNRTKHPNILEIKDICALSDPDATFNTICLVLELMDSTLREMFCLQVYLEEFQIKVVLYNLLRGLEYLHDSGLIHRDIKPENCLINHDGTAKLCDFNLARTCTRMDDAGDGPSVMAERPPDHSCRSYDEDEESNSGSSSGGDHFNTSVGTMTVRVGSQAYQAPEVILGRNDYTGAVDMWSIGCLLAELLFMMVRGVCVPVCGQCDPLRLASRRRRPPAAAVELAVSFRF
eukprot:GHVU01228690.1.p1 GENE.GHVU01228690.1~~GHVU01228690.1.p1  ORF type:complete len:306 (+),score=37.78 GHVU01228690.1:302-1219(+)